MDSIDQVADKSDEVVHWVNQLDAYTRHAKEWEKQAREINNRYSLKHSSGGSRYNVLFSNTKILQSALFSAVPMPVVKRRTVDSDTLPRIAAQVLERALAYQLSKENFHDTINRSVLDLVLIARGVVWNQYDPEIRQTRRPVTQDGEVWYTDTGETIDRSMVESESGENFYNDKEVVAEYVRSEYVHWRDFAHKPSRSWDELCKGGWVARRVYMARREGIERFGDKFIHVPVNAKTPGTIDERNKEIDENTSDKVEIWEIWDKSDRSIIWISKDYDEILDKKQDILGLENFYPCAKPLYGSLSNDNLMPIPEYGQYKHLAEELDIITARISSIASQIKVVGLYDQNANGVERLLSPETKDGDMIGVPSMKNVTQGGSGLDAAVKVLDIAPLASTLNILYGARSQSESTLYELIGISDILRGSVNPNEKAAQSKIKMSNAGLRLRPQQEMVAEFIAGQYAIKAEIIAEHFDPEYIRYISGYDNLPEVRQTLLQHPQGPDILFGKVMEFIRHEKFREFSIQVHTDTTVFQNEDAEKSSRMEFVQSVGPFLAQAIQAGQQVPELVPTLLRMILFVVKGFRAGRDLEHEFELLIQNFQQQQSQQQGQPQQPKQPTKEELEAQDKQREMQVEAQKDQIDLSIKGMKAETEAKKSQLDLQMAILKAQATGDLLRVKQLEAQRDAQLMDI